MLAESEPLLSTTDGGPNILSAQNAGGEEAATQNAGISEPVYLETLKLIPISIAMGLAIFILGLVSNTNPIPTGMLDGLNLC